MTSLESTVICLDNSEYSRNGDFIPSRLHAQQETVYDLIQSRLRSDRKNLIAMLTMAGARPEVIVPLSRDLINIQRKLFNLKPCGMVRLLTSMRIAQLVLKNRQEKGNKMRIVIFLCSPIDDEDGNLDEQLAQAGKNIRKENVNLDIVVLGSKEENEPTRNQLRSLMQVLDDCQSHIMTVNSGYDLSFVVANELNFELMEYHDELSDSIGNNNADHDLAMAIQLSLQELNKENRNIGQDTTKLNKINIQLPENTLNESLKTPMIAEIPGPSTFDDKTKIEKNAQLQMNKTKDSFSQPMKKIEVKKLDLLTFTKIPIKAQAIDKRTVVKRTFKTASQQFKNLLNLCAMKEETLPKKADEPTNKQFQKDLNKHLVRSRIMENELRLGRLRSTNRYLQSKLFNQFDEQKSATSIINLDKDETKCQNQTKGDNEKINPKGILKETKDSQRNEINKLPRVLKAEIIIKSDDITGKLEYKKNLAHSRIMENELRLGKLKSTNRILQSKLFNQFEGQKSVTSILNLKSEKCQNLEKVGNDRLRIKVPSKTQANVERIESSDCNLRKRSVTVEMITAYRRPKYTSLIFKNPYLGIVLEPTPMVKKSNLPELQKQSKPSVNLPIGKQIDQKSKKQQAKLPNVSSSDKKGNNNVKSKFPANKNKTAFNSSSDNKTSNSKAAPAEKTKPKPLQFQPRNPVNTTANNNNTANKNKGATKKKNQPLTNTTKQTSNKDKIISNKDNSQKLTKTSDKLPQQEAKSCSGKSNKITRNPNTNTTNTTNNTNITNSSNKQTIISKDHSNKPLPQQQKSIKTNVKTILNDQTSKSKSKPAKIQTKTTGTTLGANNVNDNKQKTINNNNSNKKELFKSLNKSNKR